MNDGGHHHAGVRAQDPAFETRDDFAALLIGLSRRAAALERLAALRGDGEPVSADDPLLLAILGASSALRTLRAQLGTELEPCSPPLDSTPLDSTPLDSTEAPRARPWRFREDPLR